jgi:aminoglycoside 6'-N-acetyltransferase
VAHPAVLRHDFGGEREDDPRNERHSTAGQESDLELLTGWFSDPLVYKWWGGSPVRHEVVAQKYIGQRRPAVESLLIEAQGRPIGYIQYHQGFEEYHHADEGEIDMFVAPPARRNGLGRDAAVTLVRHLVDERGWSRVTVDPAKSNPTALRFWRACGFEYERDIESGPAELLSVRQ